MKHWGYWFSAVTNLDIRCCSVLVERYSFDFIRDLDRMLEQTGAKQESNILKAEERQADF